jgi:hypothetical protein
VGLSVSLGGESGIEVRVPGGSKIDLNTGVITLPDGGAIVFSGADAAAVRSIGADSGMTYIVTPGTTVSSATGVITVTNGGDVTLSDGSTVTVEPGTTINPFTGQITQPGVTAAGEELDARGDETAASGGGCDAGTAGLALIALTLGAGVAARKRTR